MIVELDSYSDIQYNIAALILNSLSDKILPT